MGINFRSPLRHHDPLAGANKIGDAGKDRKILNPSRKSLSQSCVDHPRFKID